MITKLIIFAAALPIVVFLGKSIADQNDNKHYSLFSYLAGSAIALVMLKFTATLTQFGENAFMLAVGIVIIVGLWKFLFGPWNPRVKAMVLGTFVFWIAVDLLQKQGSAADRVAMVLAAIIAMIPSVIWCILFMRQHASKLSFVILTFFAGMLSTAPILFYDYVVRSGYDLNFFLFRITPEDFMRSSRVFVANSLTGQSGVVSASVATTVVSFLLVGVIEEWSKNWVVKNSDKAAFSSINDVIQLSIIAAIGFAFAENIVNPNYFIGFIQSYLISPAKPQIIAFAGSVLGRAIVTNMVHITSSSVLGYYYGMAFFARPVMEDDRARGKRHSFVAFIHKKLNVRRVIVFRHIKMAQGLMLAIVLHSAFDFLVSLPEVLPGNPQTIGDIFGMSSGPLNVVSVVMAVSVVYVVGGWLLIMRLFGERRDVKEYGRRFEQEVFIPETAAT